VVRNGDLVLLLGLLLFFLRGIVRTVREAVEFGQVSGVMKLMQQICNYLEAFLLCGGKRGAEMIEGSGSLTLGTDATNLLF
jgi:hypothetical protein